MCIQKVSVSGYLNYGGEGLGTEVKEAEAWQTMQGLVGHCEDFISRYEERAEDRVFGGSERVGGGR